MHVRIFNIYLNVIIRNIVINNWQQINILTNFKIILYHIRKKEI